MVNLCINLNIFFSFIDAARLVYEGVREIRRAVLLNRGTIEYDSDVEWDNPDIGKTNF